MQELLDWYEKLSREGFLGLNATLSCRQADTIACVDPMSGEVVPIEEGGRAYLTHRSIYRARPEIMAIIHSTAPATQTFSCTGRNLKPVLDDFAQLIGPSARCAATFQQASRKLKSRNAVLLKDEGALCAAPSLDDAYATAFVLEKNARAQIEGSFMGGVRRINPLEAIFMRRVYLTKYSKANRTNRL